MEGRGDFILSKYCLERARSEIRIVERWNRYNQCCGRVFRWFLCLRKWSVLIGSGIKPLSSRCIRTELYPQSHLDVVKICDPMAELQPHSHQICCSFKLEKWMRFWWGVP